MKSEVSEISPVMVEVQVEVPWETVKKDLDKTFKAVGREARVKGFRPGKVPPQLVRKLFGPQVRAEVSGNVMSQALLEAVEEHSLEVCAEPDFAGGMPEIETGEPLKFAAKLEVRPKIEEVDIDGLEIWKDEEPVTDEDVAKTIEEQRQRAVEYREPEAARAAKDDDRVVIGYTVTLDGEPAEDMGREEHAIVLGSEGLLEEFQTGLLGKSAGDETEITVTFPEDHTNDELKGKPAVFAVKVIRVEEAILPELNDKFAADQGFDSLDAMKADIRKEAEERRARIARNDVRDQLIEALGERNPVEVPPSMVKEQQQRMVYEFAQFLQMAGQMGGGLPDGIFDDLPERAERRVRGGLLLAAIAKLQGLEATEEDVDARIGEIAEKTGKHVARVRADYQGESRGELENEILNDKIMDLLESKAKVQKGKRPEKKKPDAEGDSSEG